MYENRIYIIFIIPTWHTIHLAVCFMQHGMRHDRVSRCAWNFTGYSPFRWNKITYMLILFIFSLFRLSVYFTFCRILYANPRSYTLIHENYGGIDTRIVWIN